MTVFVPTAEQRETVQTLVAYGIPQDDICLLIKNPRTDAPIDKVTLEKHFRQEIDTAASLANAKVVGALFKKATENGGDTTAQIWWTKARMKWREVQKHEVGGVNDGPISFTITPDDDRL